MKALLQMIRFYGGDFVRNVYWPNRRVPFLFLLRFYAWEMQIVFYRLQRCFQEGERFSPLAGGFTLELGNVVRMAKSGNITDYEGYIRKGDKKLVHWRRVNDRMRFEYLHPSMVYYEGDRSAWYAAA